MTSTEKFLAARATYYRAKDEADSAREREVKAEYARLRAEDKAAGRDTSGKSVQSRRTLAHDIVMMRPETRERRDAVAAIERHYQAFTKAVTDAEAEELALDAEARVQPARTQNEREAFLRFADHWWSQTAPSDPAGRGAAPRPTGSTGTSPIDATEGGAYMARKTTTRKTAAAKTSASKKTTAARKNTAAPKATATKYQQAEKTAEGLDLTALLLEGLKAEGVKASKLVAPAGHYYRVLVGKAPIAYVNHRKGGGLRIEPKLEGKELPKSVKGFTAQPKVRGGLGYIGTFTNAEEIKQAVAALVLAAAKVSAEAEKKAAAPAAARKAPAKAAADGPAVTPNAVVVREGEASLALVAVTNEDGTKTTKLEPVS